MQGRAEGIGGGEVSERDELVQIIWDYAVADRVKDGKDLRNVPVVRQKVEGMADKILAAGYRWIDHTEYGLDHKRADLQFTDDEGELWTDEGDVKDYASEYGDTAPLVKRHVTAWEAAQ